MKNQPAFLLVLLLFMCFNACVNKHDDEVKPEAALITFSSPTEGTMFLKNQVVPINGTIKAQNDIHGYEISLRNPTTKAELYNVKNPVHAKEVEFKEQWENTVTSDMALELEIKVILDHEGHTATKKVSIHCHS